MSFFEWWVRCGLLVMHNLIAVSTQLNSFLAFSPLSSWSICSSLSKVFSRLASNLIWSHYVMLIIPVYIMIHNMFIFMCFRFWVHIYITYVCIFVSGLVVHHIFLFLFTLNPTISFYLKLGLSAHLDTCNYFMSMAIILLDMGYG